MGSGGRLLEGGALNDQGKILLPIRRIRGALCQFR